MLETKGNTEQTRSRLARSTTTGVGGMADRAEDGGAHGSGNGGTCGQHRGDQHGCDGRWWQWGEAAVEAVATAVGESVR